MFIFWRPLPGEKEADLTKVSGTVDEIHLPAGGIIQLDVSLVFGLSIFIYHC